MAFYLDVTKCPANTNEDSLQTGLRAEELSSSRGRSGGKVGVGEDSLDKERGTGRLSTG